MTESKQIHNPEECTKMIVPVRDALEILNGKWKLPIILSLTFGAKRFKQISKDINGITDKMLSKELKDLEMNGMVKRTVYDTTPITVEYELTESAKSLGDVLDKMLEWGLQHRETVLSGS